MCRRARARESEAERRQPRRQATAVARRLESNNQSTRRASIHRAARVSRSGEAGRAPLALPHACQADPNTHRGGSYIALLQQRATDFLLSPTLPRRRGAFVIVPFTRLFLHASPRLASHPSTRSTLPPPTRFTPTPPPHEQARRGPLLLLCSLSGLLACCASGGRGGGAWWFESRSIDRLARARESGGSSSRSSSSSGSSSGGGQGRKDDGGRAGVRGAGHHAAAAVRGVRGLGLGVV